MSASPDGSSDGAAPAADTPAVDIIILDWNRPDDTIKAIESAVAQEGIAAKVYVVDQGSQPGNRDRVQAFCASHPGVQYIALSSNVGVAAGRNIATAAGAAPVVVSLDNDAVFTDPRCVARALAHLEADQHLGAVAFRVLDADTKEEQIWDYPEQYRGATIESFETTRFLGGGHALRRTAFEAAGGYDAALFFAGEERDLALRMINLGYRIRWFRDLAILHTPIAAGKITWSGKRYFFTVRNTLYINYKFGSGLWGFLMSAGAFIVRGTYNGLGWPASRGVWAALGMIWRFAVSGQEKARYVLSPETRRYIMATELRDSPESFWSKLTRQFTRLPEG
jgi:GT2 family glycosyltransferase